MGGMGTQAAQWEKGLKKRKNISILSWGVVGACSRKKRGGKKKGGNVFKGGPEKNALVLGRKRAHEFADCHKKWKDSKRRDALKKGRKRAEKKKKEPKGVWLIRRKSSRLTMWDDFSARKRNDVQKRKARGPLRESPDHRDLTICEK